MIGSELRSFARRVENSEYFRALAPELSITDTPLSGVSAHPSAEAAAWWTREQRCLIDEGYAQLESVVPAEDSARLATAIARLKSAGLHPIFAYVYDESWRIVARIAPALDAILGPMWALAADFWAWHVEPSAGERGWPAHRGWYDHLATAEGLPLIVNAWVALTDATPLNGCMHLVPLSRDPSFPHALGNEDVPEQSVLALPTAARDALLWNANVLHFGGTTSPRAEGPRVSVSFTAVSPAAGFPGTLLSSRAPLSFRDRLDLIAQQLVTYASHERISTALPLEWARLISGLHEARGRRR